MLLFDDGCREEYLCVERIICEGCKKETWLNGLFNIYTYRLYDDYSVCTSGT